MEIKPEKQRKQKEPADYKFLCAASVAWHFAKVAAFVCSAHDLRGCVSCCKNCDSARCRCEVKK